MGTNVKEHNLGLTDDGWSNEKGDQWEGDQLGGEPMKGGIHVTI